MKHLLAFLDELKAKRIDLYLLFHPYSCYARGLGLDMLNSAYHLLDLVPKGRDEKGLPSSMAWLRHHDRYEDQPVRVLGGIRPPSHGVTASRRAGSAPRGGCTGTALTVAGTNPAARRDDI